MTPPTLAAIEKQWCIAAGAAGIYASGRVMRLRKISDFNGNYRASSAGATIAGANLATYLQNERGDDHVHGNAYPANASFAAHGFGPLCDANELLVTSTYRSREQG